MKIYQKSCAEREVVKFKFSHNSRGCNSTPIYFIDVINDWALKHPVGQLGLSVWYKHFIFSNSEMEVTKNLQVTKKR